MTLLKYKTNLSCVSLTLTRVLLNFTKFIFYTNFLHFYRGFGSELIGKKEIRINAPVISLVGNYSINGRVLILPIQGDGRCNLTLDNLVFIMKFNGKSVTKNGKEYLKPDKFKAAFTTTR